MAGIEQCQNSCVEKRTPYFGSPDDPNFQFSGESSFEPETLPFFRSSFKFQCPESEPNCAKISPLRDGTVAVPPTGEDSLSARIEMIRNAKHSIRIEALIFRGDESGLYIADILKQKKKDNPSLDIRVIVDTASNATDLQTQKMYIDLIQHGIPVQGAAYQIMNEASLHDLKALDRRSHEKLFLIDASTPDAIGVMGGLNIGNEYFHLGLEAKDRWRDHDSILRGDVIADAAAGFDKNFSYFLEVKRHNIDTAKYWKQWKSWVTKNYGNINVKLHYKTDPRITKKIIEIEGRFALHHLEFVPARIRFLQSRPRLKETYIEQAYDALIRSSKSLIKIANAYFIPPESYRKVLTDAAARLGRDKITVVTNSTASNDLPPMTLVGRSYYEDLIEAGIKIFEWAGEGTLHAKAASFDKAYCIIGSFNFDQRSEDKNSESAVAIESEGACKAIAQLIDEDVQSGRKISSDDACEFLKPDEFINRCENADFTNPFDVAEKCAFKSPKQAQAVFQQAMSKAAECEF